MSQPERGKRREWSDMARIFDNIESMIQDDRKNPEKPCKPTLHQYKEKLSDDNMHSNNAPITFRLLNAWYVPELDAALLLGVTKDGDGVVVKTKLNHYFYIDRKRPFEDEIDVRRYIGALQAHLNACTDSQIMCRNPYLVDESFESKSWVKDPFVLPQKVGYTSEWSFTQDYLKHINPCGVENRNIKVNEAFKNMFVDENVYDEQTLRTKVVKKCRFLKGTKRTMAHYTVDEDKLVLGKIWVSKPWQAISFKTYSESKQYYTFAENTMKRDIKMKKLPSDYVSEYNNEDYLVRLYECTEPVVMQLCDNNIHIGKWCTVNNYKVLSGDDRICYRKYNIESDLTSITCSMSDETLCKINILSYDLETASGATQYSTNPASFPVAFEGRLPEDAWKYNRVPEVYTSTLDRKLASARASGVDTTSPNFLMKTDPVTIIGTVKKREGEQQGLDYMEGKIFVYKHENADMTEKIETWLNTIKGKISECVPKFVKDFEDREICNGNDISKPNKTALAEVMNNAGHNGTNNNLVNMGWVYDKIEIFEYDDEIEMISAFISYLHDSDIDVLSGWNTRYFDARYIYERWCYHKIILCRNLPHFNMTCFIHGISKLGLVKDNIVLNYDLYVDNDGILIWKVNKEDTPHKLNVVANRVLNLPQNIANIAICLAYENISLLEIERGSTTKQKYLQIEEYDGDDNSSECESVETESIQENIDCQELFDNMANNYRFISAKTTEDWDIVTKPYLFELWKIANDADYAAETKFLWATNDDEDSTRFTFKMRKVEFEHRQAANIWKSGGMDMLAYVGYNFIDCILPLCIISSKGKFVAQLNFAVVTGACYSYVYSAGQMAKSITAIRKQCKLRHRPEITDTSDQDNGDFTGEFIFHERGNLHYHHPCIFRGKETCENNVKNKSNEYRLMANVRKYDYKNMANSKKQEEIEAKAIKAKCNTKKRKAIKPSKYPFKKRKVQDTREKQSTDANFDNNNFLNTENIEKNYANSDDEDDNFDVITALDCDNFYDDFKANPKNAKNRLDLDDYIYSDKFTDYDEFRDTSTTTSSSIRDGSQILISDQVGQHDYKDVKMYGFGMMDAISNQGGKVLNPFEPGLKQDIVVTTDASSFYPSAMGSDGLAFENYITEEYFKKYNIPKYSFTSRDLGSHFLNAAGDANIDEKAAIFIGSETPCIKTTHFMKNVKSVVPDVVASNFDERDIGKQFKALWTAAANAVKANEADYSKFRSNPSRIVTALIGKNSRVMGDFDFSPSVLRELHIIATEDEDHDTFFQDTYDFDVEKWYNKFDEYPKVFKDPRRVSAVLNVVKCFYSLNTAMEAKSSSNLWIENYDQYQLEVKCLMNSLYGVMMMTYGPLSLFEISATVTATCRLLLSTVQSICERSSSTFTKKTFANYKEPWSTNPGGKKNVERIENMPKDPFPFKTTNIRNIKGLGKMYRLMSDHAVDLYVDMFKIYEAIVAYYGDSVTGDTALIVRIDGKIIQTRRIDELLDEKHWDSYRNGEKEQHKPTNLEVWNNGGFTKIKRVIRHECKKKIVRVLTHTGIVDCTEDHSLVNSKGDEISPKDVKIGDLLLHDSDDTILLDSLTPGDQEFGIVTPEEAYAMGAFVADGSCGEYTYSTGPKYSWYICKLDLEHLENVAKHLPFKTKIIDARKSSGVYKLIPNDLVYGGIRDITIKYKLLFYNTHGEKKIPHEILAAPLNIVQQFWNGFYAGDGSKAEQKKQTAWRFDQKGKEICTGLWLLSRRLGWKVSLNDISGKPSIFRLNCTKSSQRKPCDAIKKIYTLMNSGDEKSKIYVYDLETESHHFHVGPGRLIVHNTDSVMLGLKRHSVVNFDQAFDAMMQLTTLTNHWLYKRFKFAPEKISDRMIVTAKQKMYDMMAFLERSKPLDNEWYFKGSDKSDIIPFLATFIAKCKKFIFLKLREGFKLEDTLSIVIQRTQKILLKFSTGQIPLHFLAVSKKLNKYTPGGSSQHNVVADKKIRRGEQVVVGDVITFVKIIENSTDKKGSPIRVSTVEDLSYVLDNINTITVDYKGLFEKKVKNHLLSFLSSVYCTIIDIPHAQSTFTSVRSFKSNLVTQNISMIENYLSMMLFYGPSGIITRLDLRNKIRLDEVRKKNQIGSFVRILECNYCFGFYRDENHCYDSILSRISDDAHVKRCANICPSCVGNADLYIEKIEKKLKKYTKVFTTQRAICKTCIEAPMMPKPSFFEVTPESCRFDQCPTHVKRTEITDKNKRLDSLLYSLKLNVLYDKYTKYLDGNISFMERKSKIRRIEIQYDEYQDTNQTEKDIGISNTQNNVQMTIKDRLMYTHDYYDAVSSW